MASHRPYSSDPNSPPSVTQVLSLMDKPGLVWGAARETANFAVRHQDSWRDMPVDTAVTTLSRHHRGVWDHRALIGTAIHTVNSQWCAGHTVRLADVITEMREASPLWQRKTEQDLYAELLPMADGLGKMWQRLKLETLGFEQVVRYRPPDADGLDYIGQTDWRALVDGRPLLLELKTTGNTTPGKAKYWDTWRLQLAAYRYASHGVEYTDDDEEVCEKPLTEVDGAAVIHVYGDGCTQVDGVQAGPAEHEVFLALRRAYGWRKAEGSHPGDDRPVLMGVGQ